MLANSSWIASNKRLPKRPPMGSCLSSSKVTMARLPRLAVTATWQTALVDNRTEEWRSYRLKTVRHLDCWTERDGSFAQSSGAKKGEKQLGRHHDMILMDRQTGMFLCTKATHKRLSVSSAHGHSPCCTTMRLTWTRLSWHCVFSPTTMALGETLANSEGQAHRARASACAKDRREAAQDCCKFVIDQWICLTSTNEAWRVTEVMKNHFEMCKSFLYLIGLSRSFGTNLESTSILDTSRKP